MKSKGVISQQERARGREFTERQRTFLELLVQNDFKEPTKLLKKAGYKDAAWAHIYALKEDIKEIAEGILIGHTPSAALTLVEVMVSDKPVPNSGARLTAAKEILDRVGLTKEERVKHQVEHVGGIFMIPAKAPINYDDAIEGELCDQ